MVVVVALGQQMAKATPMAAMAHHPNAIALRSLRRRFLYMLRLLLLGGNY